jgi:hypothetical protein
MGHGAGGAERVWGLWKEKWRGGSIPPSSSLQDVVERSVAHELHHQHRARPARPVHHGPHQRYYAPVQARTRAAAVERRGRDSDVEAERQQQFTAVPRVRGMECVRLLWRRGPWPAHIGISS